MPEKGTFHAKCTLDASDRPFQKLPYFLRVGCRNRRSVKEENQLYKMASWVRDDQTIHASTLLCLHVLKLAVFLDIKSFNLHAVRLLWIIILIIKIG